MNSICLALLIVVVPYFIQAALISETEKSFDDGKEDPTLSEEQINILNQFLAANSNAEIISNSFGVGILRANKWDSNAAAKALKRILQWRRSNKIDNLGISEANGKMLSLFPYSLAVVSRNGCPVLALDANKWFVADFMESHDFVKDALESFSNYATQIFEKTSLAVKNSENCDQAILLVDGKGLSSKNFAEANSLNGALRISITVEHYYPNLFKKIVLINSHSDLINLVKMIEPYLGQTAKVISVFSEAEEDQARKLVYKYIDPEQLPEAYLGVKDI